jgi:PIN domain nuclease of toxin-antitoxin system
VTALLLDTHVWIWLAAGDCRLARHERALNRAAQGNELLISAVSAYEAALIGLETDSGRRRGRQAVKMRPSVHQWIRDAITATRVVPVPIDEEMALNAAGLQAMHPDPFDRIIVATAGSCRAQLVTADSRVIAFAKDARLNVVEL